MDHKNLPAEFLDEMKRILGNEYPSFLSSYDSPARKGLRLNRLKVDAGENGGADGRDVQHAEGLPGGTAVLAREAGFHLTRIPWTDNGYFYDEADMPSRHPFYSAGLYYLQEPSAMAPAQILPVKPGDKVLDLCAAPGGKTTELGARLQGRGLLIANEISPVRVKALVRNVNLFGIANACVTNTDSTHLLSRYPGFFDKILVDAPCSGEGMFRKDEEAVRTWSREKVQQYAATQCQIIVDAADMLKDGGMMVYSTCTFAPEEDEMTILHLLEKRPEMELVPVLREGGREGFAPGLSAERLKELGYLAGKGGESCGISGDFKTAGTSGVCETSGIFGASGEEAPDLTFTCRLWPHRVEGEGHFVALLRKKGGPVSDRSGDACVFTKEDTPAGTGMTGHDRRKTGKKTKNRKGAAAEPARTGLTTEEQKLVRDFIKPYLQDGGQTSLEELMQGGRLEVHDSKVYYMPADVFTEPGTKTVRAGIYLGELKKNRFEPEQELAMALPALSPWGQAPEDLGLYVSLDPDDERLESYLHGNTIEVKQSRENGWRLLCAGRYPVGWGKLVNGQLKNKYPAGWRIP